MSQSPGRWLGVIRDAGSSYSGVRAKHGAGDAKAYITSQEKTSDALPRRRLIGDEPGFSQ
jgi:hypothetical protein